MSSRDATLNIHNGTPYRLTLSIIPPTVIEGIYATLPPSAINPGATGSFKVAKTSDTSRSGPEGHCYYTFCTGPETISVDIYWNHPENDNDRSIYTAIETPNRGLCSTGISHGGPDQTVEYYINYPTTALNDYSLIVALTATSINSALLSLQQQGLIAQSLTAPAASGSVPQVSLTRLGPPQVAVPSGQSSDLQLQVHVTQGTLTWNNGGTVTTTSLNGATLCFDVPLTLSVVNDPGAALALPEAQETLQELAAQGLVIYGIFLDWTHNVSGLTVQGVTLDDTQMAALEQALRGFSAPPWPVAYSAQSPGAAPPNVPLSDFVPTSAETSATPSSANANLSTVNLLAMCMRGALPTTLSSRKSFSSPFVTSTDDYGMIVYDAHLFDIGYLKAVVLSALGRAMQETMGASSYSISGAVPSWTLTSVYSNSGDNYGKGEKVEEDNEVDVWVVETLTASCHVAVADSGTSSGQIKLSVSGSFDDKATATKYPLADGGLVSMNAGTVEYKQSWSFNLLLSGGDDGTIPVSISTGAITFGDVQTIQEDEGFMEAAGDWVRGLFSDDSSVLDGMASQGATFTSSLQTSLSAHLDSELQQTTASIVLPTGERTSGRAVSMDGRYNVHASFTILAAS